jgi:hypothetical protein
MVWHGVVCFTCWSYNKSWHQVCAVDRELFHNTFNKYLFSHNRFPCFVLTHRRTSCETRSQNSFRKCCCFLTDPASAAVNISCASKIVHRSLATNAAGIAKRLQLTHYKLHPPSSYTPNILKTKFQISVFTLMNQPLIPRPLP